MGYEYNTQPTIEQFEKMTAEERRHVPMSWKMKLLEEPVEVPKKNEDLFFGEIVQ